MCDNENQQFDYVKSLQDEIKQLRKEKEKFESFDVLRLRLALDKIDGASQYVKMASGVMIEIFNLDGQGITGKFGIVDGLSESTIAAIKADIERTMKFRFDMSAPKGLRENTNLMFRAEK